MHPDTPPTIKALHETLCFRSHAYEHAKHLHGIYSPVACKALAALDDAQDAFDDAYNEFLRTTNLASAPIKPSQEKEVASIYATHKEELAALNAELAAEIQAKRSAQDDCRTLGRELRNAEARLEAVAAVLKSHSLHLTEQAHAALADALYRNSI